MSTRRGKGEGSLYQRADGRWLGVVDISIPGGGRKRRTVSAKTKQEARAKLTALKKRTAAGAKGDGSQTVQAWVTYWLDEISTARDTTKATYRGYLTNWITPQIGRVRLADLSPEHVRSMLKAMEKAGRSPATRRQVLTILSAALRDALREGKVERNVCDTVARPSLANQETHGSLTLAEVARLWPHIEAHPNGARWAAALVLGIRQGEALALAWEDVALDDAEPWLHIKASLARVDGELRVGPVKSRAADRVLPIIEPVLHLLRTHRDAHGDDGLVWGPRHNKADYEEWHALLDAAGVRRVPVHAARATAASVLDAMGATPRQIADILGHSTVRVAQQHYVHSDRADLRAALTRSGAAMLGIAAEKPAADEAG